MIQGQSIGATCVQIFTSNQRQWKARVIDKDEINKFKDTMKKTNILKVMSHGSYLVNLGSPDSESLEKSRQTFREEIKRCHQLGINYLAFHPGSSLKRSKEEAMDTIIESILLQSELINSGDTEILLESTAGQGTNLGSTFEELKYILNGIKGELNNVGICLDTCHMFAAGYDIRDEESFNNTFNKFDEIIGLEYLKAFHINDSKVPLNSKKDRHESLGQGFIGWKAFQLLMQDKRTRDVPKFLETPRPEIWKNEIEILRSFYEGKTLKDLNLSEEIKIEIANPVVNKKRKNQTKSKLPPIKKIKNSEVI